MKNGKCRLVQFTELGKIVYTCDYVRGNIEAMKHKFKEDNAVDESTADKYYAQYCDQIQSFLDKCKCGDISLTCDTCTPEQHEGHFCRCESRNIALAKQLREKCLSPWQKP